MLNRSGCFSSRPEEYDPPTARGGADLPARLRPHQSQVRALCPVRSSIRGEIRRPKANQVSSEAPTGTNWNVYIDGLNFYSAVRSRPDTKWIDLRALADRLVPRGDSVSKVKYFTSQISEKASEDSDAPRRQRVFIRAVRATGVEVLEGKFKVPDGWRAISSKGNWEDRFRPSLPVEVLNENGNHFSTHDSRPWKARVELPEEKFTDVAIASHLLRDFYRGACSCAIVVSNDSDLRPAIELAVEDGHHVGVFSPMGTVSRDLARVASWAKPIRVELLAQCQMPDEIQVPGSNRTLNRPEAWK